MTKNEKILTCKLLKVAAEEFSNKGCNDFDFAHWMPNLAERRALIKAYHEFNGDPENYDPTAKYETYPDFILASFMAQKIDEEID